MFGLPSTPPADTAFDPEDPSWDSPVIGLLKIPAVFVIVDGAVFFADTKASLLNVPSSTTTVVFLTTCVRISNR